MLADKVIVIVGGTTGLGLSAARACLAAGARGLVVVGKDEPGTRDAEAVLNGAAGAADGRAAGVTADATNPATAPAAIDLAVRRFGGFHALYHVAGGSGRRAGDGPLHDVTDAGWQFTLDLNLTSMFYSNRAAAQRFLTQGGGTGGCVLNVGSVLGWSPSPRHFATHAYAAAKAAVVGFTKSCAAYYAPHNIRFNLIAPGLVDTPMARRAGGDPAVQAFARAKQPLDGGRVGRPDDLDAAVVYLLSDAAKFVTGQVLAVDGGWSVSEGRADGGGEA